MSKVPPTTEQLSDVDQMYRRLSAQDAGRPGEWVRRKVQAYAAQQAAERAVRSNIKGNETVSVAAAPPPPRSVPVSDSEDLTPPAGKRWVIPAVVGAVVAMAAIGWFVVPAMLGSSPPPKAAPVVAQPEIPPPPVAQAPAPAEPAASQASEPEPAEVSPAQTPVTAEAGRSEATASSTPPGPVAAPPAPQSARRSPAAAAIANSTQAHRAIAPASRAPFATATQAATQQANANTRVARQNTAPAQGTPSEPTASAAPAAYSVQMAETAPAPKPAASVETPVAMAPSAPAPTPPPAQSATATAPAPAPAPAPAATAAAAGSAYPPDRLFTAAKAGDMTGLQGAFDSHVDVNSIGPEGETALILAIQHDRVEAVRVLLSHGANPNTPDTRGLTPIRAARVRNNYNVLQALQHAAR